ncbi:MAG TPA: PIN domain-containing protein [Candidatus Acidoferrales bacterium]|nr:PIN domain-containing protein [Candidatus Acidoferrales bacterium]
MSERRIVDTNLIVRFLVQDQEKQASAAGKLFEACDCGEVLVVVLVAVLAECVFVLESFYQHARGDIASALSTLISSPGVEINDVAIHLDALERYKKTHVHFVDCVIAAAAAAEKTPVATFDQDFRKFSNVRVEIH